MEFEYSFKESDVNKLELIPPIQKSSGKMPKVAGLLTQSSEYVSSTEQKVSNGRWHHSLLDNEAGSLANPVFHEMACTTPRLHSAKGVPLSNEYLHKRNGVKDFSQLSCLNLHNYNITGIDMLRGLPSLKVLVMSFNKITQITGLDDLSLLERLDLSYNLLKRIEGLSGLSNLLTLDLAGNEIWCPDDLSVLQLHVCPRFM